MNDGSRRDDATIDAVLLDAAGTLIATAEPVAETYARFARRYGGDVDSHRLRDAFPEVFGRMPPMAFSEVSAAELEKLEKGWWRSLVGRVFAVAGGSVPEFEAFFEALYEHYATGAAWVLYPEVAEVVRSLNEGGCKVAVVSNFDSRLPAILQDHRLEHLFAEIVYSTGVGAAKPDSRIFLHTLEKLGIPPDRAVHVGDSRVADYEGATSAGLEALLLMRSENGDGEASAHEIRGLEQLIPWVHARSGR